MQPTNTLTKRQVRRLALKNRRELSPEQRRSQSRQIFELLKTNVAFNKAKTIFCYVSVEDEVHTEKIIKLCLEQQKTLCIPYIIDATACRMIAARLSSQEQLVPGTFDILTVPDDQIEEISPQAIDLVIVPGAAFDETGHRIGMGGGYYDRFLALSSVSGAKSIGLAYSCQLFSELPVESHDKSVDMVLTVE